jgi:toxin ParE1/3/4
MGYQVIWTDEAIDDLREIVAFISKDNPAAAVKLGEALIQKSMILAEHPRVGRMFRKVAQDSLRELIVPPYRLIYEINDTESAIYVRLL